MKKTAKFFAIVLLGVFVVAGFVGAQESDPETVDEIGEKFSFEKAAKEEVPAVAPIPSGTSDHLRYRLAQGEDRSFHVLIVSGLLLGSLTIILAFLTRGKGAYTPVHLVTATGLPLVVFGTILVILLADTEQQLTAAVGILGAVAGYVFRSMQTPDTSKNGNFTDRKSSEPAPPHP